jgi:hypothetical protein
MSIQRWCALTVVALIVVGSAAVLQASGPAGCYGIVEKVVLEPNDSAPERVQVWGVFAIGDGKAGDGYLEPRRGYLYFKLPESAAVSYRGSNVTSRTAALAEWNDLKSVAGSGEVIAFADRSSAASLKVHLAAEKTASPEFYPLFSGIAAVSGIKAPSTGVVSKLQEASKKK